MHNVQMMDTILSVMQKSTTGWMG